MQKKNMGEYGQLYKGKRCIWCVFIAFGGGFKSDCLDVKCHLERSCPQSLSRPSVFGKGKVYRHEQILERGYRLHKSLKPYKRRNTRDHYF